jgi:anthranilate phosphoribosyltransferase
LAHIPELLSKLVAGRDLDDDQVEAAMQAMMSDRFGEAETAALLMAWRMKGETAAEIGVAAACVRRHMVRLDSGRDDVLDTCGTGGDGKSTFNISTATALVVASLGVPVVKHGNRAVSGRTGSADVLRLLGVTMHADPNQARACLDATGVTFCLASDFHPAWQRVGALRRRLGVQTIFNYLGPLANPASAPYQLLGVGRADMLDPVAGALARLGTRRALVVRGCDGLDEVSLGAPTDVREVRGNTVRTLQWHPDEFGLRACSIAHIVVDSPEESAIRIREVLAGAECPAADLVIANAAGALYAAERVPTMAEGVRAATQAVRAGRAQAALEQLVAYCRSCAATLPERA